MDKFPGQGRHRVRFDWAGQGASAVTVDADVAVVVDVLSFTTTLTGPRQGNRRAALPLER